jgi:hypothetical protein
VPDITAAQARQVWDRYVAVSGAQAVKAGNPALALPLETGPRRAFDSAAIRSLGPSVPALGHAASRLVSPVYTAPTFYLPERSGYPRFFVADVSEKAAGQGFPAAAGPVSGDGARIDPLGPRLMLFEQAGAGAPWLLASASSLAAGERLPKLAADSAGYVPAVPPSDPSLLAKPDDTGPLQAGLVDDGPASAATRAVASGPLTTGLYRGALGHASGMTAPHDDVYQWELEGADYPVFALRTADGGALVFYAMALDTTVAVPDYINKSDPVRSGPPIQVPANIQPLLPPGRPAPLVQLSADQTLSFAAIDPPPGNAKIQVIAIGGGPTSASAS